METENTESREKSKTWEDYFSELTKNPVTTFSGGLIGGFLIGMARTDKKIEELEKRHEQEVQKRDEQFAKLLEQMSAGNNRQGQVLKALALHPGEETGSKEQ